MEIDIDQKTVDALPEYKKNGNCIKCGGHNAKTKFSFTRYEYLERECVVCGYTWKQKCKDHGRIL